MAHLVRHRTPAGDMVTHEVDDLDAAVARVERLRNDDHADDVRVFAEVPLQFETYVRVSVATADPSAPVPPVDAPVEPVDVAADPMVDEPAPVPPATPVPPPPGVLAPVRVDAPSADADELVDASPVDGRKGLFHRGSPSA